MNSTALNPAISEPTRPVKTGIGATLSRAFGWNLAKVIPSQAEVTTLESAGISDPVLQKYSAWRRSLLTVAAIWTTVALVLSIVDIFQDGFTDLTIVGIGFEFAWLASSALLAIACIVGAARWKRPGHGSTLLIIAWASGFLLPFIYALLPVSVVYKVHAEAVSEGDMLGKAKAMGALAVGFVLSAGEYLLLLPAVLSLIPGTVNGCLRIKSLLPASQVPGWLLVCAAPLFLLFWIIILVIVNRAANNWLLVFGVLLWAGAPIWFSLCGKVFVQSHLTAAEAARIGKVKRLVGITTMAGLGLMLTFALTAKVGGLKVLGFDHAHAFSTKIDELSEQHAEATDKEDDVSFHDVQESFDDSTSLVYALDLSSWRFVVDFLAKLFVVTLVFADLIFRAAVSAWKNERKLRGDAAAQDYDATMNQAANILGEP